MPRRYATNPTRPNRHIVACIGDSITYARSLAVRPEEFYPEQLAGLLRAAGCTVTARNFGFSGDTSGPTSPLSTNTPGVSIRAPMLFPSYQTAAGSVTGYGWEVPDLAIVYAGINDINATLAPRFVASQIGSGAVNVGVHGYAISFVNGGVESAATVKLSFTVTGSSQQVLLENLPLGSTGTTARKVYRTTAGGSTLGLVATISDNTSLSYVDTLADSGLGAAPASSVSQLTASSVNPVITTFTIQRTIKQLLDAGVTRILYVSKAHYLNYSSGGDTQSTQLNTWQALRSAQSAVQTQTNPEIASFDGTHVFDPAKVVSADLFAAFSALIANSTPVTYGTRTYVFAQGVQSTPPPPGGFNWHVADSNVHLNAVGQAFLARTLFAALPATWKTAMQS